MKRIFFTAAVIGLGNSVGCADRPAGANATAERAAAEQPLARQPLEQQPPARQPPTAPDGKDTAAAAAAAAADSAEPVSAPAKNDSPRPAKDVPPRRTAVRPGAEQRITFDDLNCGMQADIVFREWMLTDRVKELDGQMVRVTGYMHPDVKQKGINEFILLRNTECKFGPSGQADHLIRVKLEPGVTTSFHSKPVEVLGKLTVNPFTGPDEKTWSIFDMTGKSVELYRR